MTDPIAFGLARLAEEESAATAAQPGPWTLDEWTGGFGRMACVMTPFASAGPGAKTGLTSLAKLGTQDYETARHIALHDPARALREIDKNRKILAEHRPVEMPLGIAWRGCATCQDPSGGRAMFPCKTVRLTLAIWDGHPDYDKRWAAG
jgi:Family of unknown function (DUF6221)